jgi:hypothetical protein
MNMIMGDKKQATILGVVAVVCVGMLGKTALGSFSGGASNQPMKVQVLGGPGTAPRTDVNPSVVPATGAETKSSARNTSSAPTPIIRDAFSKPSIPIKTKPWTTTEKGHPSAPESQTATPEGLGGKVVIEPEAHLPRGKAGTELPNQTSPARDNTSPKFGSKVRFDGYVEAGSPMGVISIDGKSHSVCVGDSVINGFTIRFLSNDRITIRKGKISKTILIGKETEF